MKQHVDSTVCIVGACFHGLPKQILWKSNMWFKENNIGTTSGMSKSWLNFSSWESVIRVSTHTLSTILVFQDILNWFRVYILLIQIVSRCTIHHEVLNMKIFGAITIALNIELSCFQMGNRTKFHICNIN
jgi:hypothetical protein